MSPGQFQVQQNGVHSGGSLTMQNMPNMANQHQTIEDMDTAYQSQSIYQHHTNSGMAFLLLWTNFLTILNTNHKSWKIEWIIINIKNHVSSYFASLSSWDFQVTIFQIGNVDLAYCANPIHFLFLFRFITSILLIVDSNLQPTKLFANTFASSSNPLFIEWFLMQSCIVYILVHYPCTTLLMQLLMVQRSLMD